MADTGRTKTRVAVVMGGVSAEREVSLRSGNAVLEAMDRGRFDPVSVEIHGDGRWSVAGESSLTPEKALTRILDRGVDAAFLALHGPGGEDGTIQGFLEVAGIPYTGSGVAASALAMDKIAARAVLTAAGLRVAPGAVVSARAVRADAGAAAAAAAALGRPLFVKAPCQGSSFGVFRVDSDDPRALRQALDRAFEFGPRALLERAVDGVEITVPVLGNAADGSARALPAVEIRPGSSRFFDTNEKYSEAGAEELCPPISLTAAVLGAAADAALAAHEALGCAGVSRTDMIASPEGLHVLEVNTLPGLTPRSLLPRSAAVAGIPFPELVSRLIDFALVKERP